MFFGPAAQFAFGDNPSKTIAAIRLSFDQLVEALYGGSNNPIDYVQKVSSAVISCFSTIGAAILYRSGPPSSVSKDSIEDKVKALTEFWVVNALDTRRRVLPYVATPSISHLSDNSAFVQVGGRSVEPEISIPLHARIVVQKIYSSENLVEVAGACGRCHRCHATKECWYSQFDARTTLVLPDQKHHHFTNAAKRGTFTTSAKNKMFCLASGTPGVPCSGEEKVAVLFQDSTVTLQTVFDDDHKSGTIEVYALVAGRKMVLVQSFNRSSGDPSIKRVFLLAPWHQNCSASEPSFQHVYELKSPGPDASSERQVNLREDHVFPLVSFADLASLKEVQTTQRKTEKFSFAKTIQGMFADALQKHWFSFGARHVLESTALVLDAQLTKVVEFGAVTTPLEKHKLITSVVSCVLSAVRNILFICREFSGMLSLSDQLPGGQVDESSVTLELIGLKPGTEHTACGTTMKYGDLFTFVELGNPDEQGDRSVVVHPLHDSMKRIRKPENWFRVHHSSNIELAESGSSMADWLTVIGKAVFSKFSSQLSEQVSDRVRHVVGHALDNLRRRVGEKVSRLEDLDKDVMDACGQFFKDVVFVLTELFQSYRGPPSLSFDVGYEVELINVRIGKTLVLSDPSATLHYGDMFKVISQTDAESAGKHTLTVRKLPDNTEFVDLPADWFRVVKSAPKNDENQLTKKLLGWANEAFQKGSSSLFPDPLKSVFFRWLSDMKETRLEVSGKFLNHKTPILQRGWTGANDLMKSLDKTLKEGGFMLSYILGHRTDMKTLAVGTKLLYIGEKKSEGEHNVCQIEYSTEVTVAVAYSEQDYDDKKHLQVDHGGARCSIPIGHLRTKNHAPTVSLPTFDSLPTVDTIGHPEFKQSLARIRGALDVAAETEGGEVDFWFKSLNELEVIQCLPWLISRAKKYWNKGSHWAAISTELLWMFSVASGTQTVVRGNLVQLMSDRLDPSNAGSVWIVNRIITNDPTSPDAKWGGSQLELVGGCELCHDSHQYKACPFYGLDKIQLSEAHEPSVRRQGFIEFSKHVRYDEKDNLYISSEKLKLVIPGGDTRNRIVSPPIVEGQSQNAAMPKSIAENKFGKDRGAYLFFHARASCKFCGGAGNGKFQKPSVPGEFECFCPRDQNEQIESQKQIGLFWDATLKRIYDGGKRYFYHVKVSDGSWSQFQFDHESAPKNSPKESFDLKDKLAQVLAAQAVGDKPILVYRQDYSQFNEDGYLKCRPFEDVKKCHCISLAGEDCRVVESKHDSPDEAIAFSDEVVSMAVYEGYRNSPNSKCHCEISEVLYEPFAYFPSFKDDVDGMEKLLVTTAGWFWFMDVEDVQVGDIHQRQFKDRLYLQRDVNVIAKPVQFLSGVPKDVSDSDIRHAVAMTAPERTAIIFSDEGNLISSPIKALLYVLRSNRILNIDATSLGKIVSGYFGACGLSWLVGGYFWLPLTGAMALKAGAELDFKGLGTLFKELWADIWGKQPYTANWYTAARSVAAMFASWAAPVVTGYLVGQKAAGHFMNFVSDVFLAVSCKRCNGEGSRKRPDGRTEQCPCTKIFQARDDKLPTKLYCIHCKGSGKTNGGRVWCRFCQGVGGVRCPNPNCDFKRPIEMRLLGVERTSA